jgi:uncharacterized membrane protein
MHDTFTKGVARMTAVVMSTILPAVTCFVSAYRLNTQVRQSLLTITPTLS